MAMRSKRQTVPTTRRSQIGQQRRSVGGGWEEKFDMSDVKVAFEVVSRPVWLVLHVHYWIFLYIRIMIGI